MAVNIRYLLIIFKGDENGFIRLADMHHT